MKRSTTWLASLLAVVIAGALSGCNSASPTADKDTGKNGHEHAHEHAHEGPHGGHLIEFGEEEYHGEWTHDESGKITVYILDGAAKKTVPIAAEKLTIDVKVGDNTKSYDLLAVNRTEGDMPMAFQFETVDKSLLGGLEAAGEGIEATLKADINGKAFIGKIEHDHGHEHKH